MDAGTLPLVGGFTVAGDALKLIQLIAGGLLIREGLRNENGGSVNGVSVPSNAAVRTRLGYVLPDKTLDDLVTQIRRGQVKNDGSLRPLPKLKYAYVRNIKERLGILRDLIREDAKTPETIMEARSVVSQRVRRQGRIEWAIAERDYDNEARAIFNAMRSAGSSIGLRYVADPVEDDTFSHATAMRFAPGEDCFVHGTLVLRDDRRLVPVETLRTGDRIWGRDRWSIVEAAWDKGVLPTHLIRLNNGSSMRLTPDHKVWIQACERHGDFDSAANGPKNCSAGECGAAYAALRRIYVRELKPGHRLIRPDRVEPGRENVDPDRAFIEGLYLSDGFSFGAEEPRRFAISGQDGCPKEAQKRRVVEACERLGVRTSWARKYVTVFDKVWAARVKLMGERAPQKRALSLDLDVPATAALYDGIVADSGAQSHGGGRVLTTTSRELFVQTRVLAKTLGLTCSEAYIVEHDGLGRNPIWRLSVWKNNPAKRLKTLRVREVIADGIALPCCDITTDDHFVWLPEADWTVSQCDGGVVRGLALLRAIGFQTMLVAAGIGEESPGVPARAENHVWGRVGLPKLEPTYWKAFDWSVDEPFGWEIPGIDDWLKTHTPNPKLPATERIYKVTTLPI